MSLAHLAQSRMICAGNERALDVAAGMKSEADDFYPRSLEHRQYLRAEHRRLFGSLRAVFAIAV